MGLKTIEATAAQAAIMPIVASTTVCAAHVLNAEHVLELISVLGAKIANSKAGTVNNKVAIR